MKKNQVLQYTLQKLKNLTCKIQSYHRYLHFSVEESLSARTTTLGKFLLLFYQPFHAQNAAFRGLNLHYFSPRITLLFCQVMWTTFLGRLKERRGSTMQVSLRTGIIYGPQNYFSIYRNVLCHLGRQTEGVHS